MQKAPTPFLGALAPLLLISPTGKRHSAQRLMRAVPVRKDLRASTLGRGFVWFHLLLLQPMEEHKSRSDRFVLRHLSCGGLGKPLGWGEEVRGRARRPKTLSHLSFPS